MQVHWFEQRQADVPAGDEWLGVRERERLQTLRFPKRRADWRLGRWTAKLAVAAWLADACDLASIEIIPDAAGAPEVWIDGERLAVATSLSHSAGIAVCALAERGPIGCDIELVESRSREFIAEYFTEDEQTLVAAAGAKASTATTLIWSAKESALKALREGLRRDTRSVAVTFASDSDGSFWNPLTVRCDTGEVLEGWWQCVDRMVRTVVVAEQPKVRLLVDGSEFATQAIPPLPPQTWVRSSELLQKLMFSDTSGPAE